jgi:hypothetical protein
MDSRIEAIRNDKVVGRGTCSSIDETMGDNELIEGLAAENVRTPAQAVKWARKNEQMWLEQGLDARFGDDDDDQLVAYKEFKKNCKLYPIDAREVRAASLTQTPPERGKETEMARQTATAKKIETETKPTVKAPQISGKEGSVNDAPKYSPSVLKAMGASLKAAEKAIAEELGNIAHSEYAIGKTLATIREDELYLAGGHKDFSTYLNAKSVEWRKDRMSLYNYINLANLSQKQVEKVGKTLAAKIGAAANLNSKAAKEIVSTVEKALDEGKDKKAVTGIVIDMTRKIRDEAGVVRAPGRNGKAENSPKPETKPVTTITGKTGNVPVRIKDQTLDLVEQDNNHWAYKATGEHNGQKFEILVNVEKLIVRIRPC